MCSKKFFLTAAVICFILYIISLFVKIKYENFDPSSGSIMCPDDGFWWEKEPPKQIVSLITGVRFPVIAKNPADAIRSDFQIPFIQAGDVESSGCIGIDESTGTYTKQICDKNNMQQLWMIKPVRNEDDLRSIIEPGKNNYSMLKGDDDTVVLPQGVKYGFFMVISKSNNGVLALASNGGNLTIQTVGNFTAQFWDITRDPGQASISIYDTNDFTELSTSYVNSPSQSQSQDKRNVGLNPIMPLNSQAGSIYQATGEGANEGPNKTEQKEINLNFNITGESLSSLLSDSPSTLPSTVREGFSKNNTKNCPVCPSILTDYISKKGIPCYGCNL
jgi:cbb3-type cytochrome oxidase subunit 3